MKYTKYVYEGKFIDLNQSKTNNELLLPLYTLLTIMVSFILILPLSFSLCGAFIYDIHRMNKCYLIKQYRRI